MSVASPRVAVLDVNETLSDLSGLRPRLTDVGAPPELLALWFAATLREGFAITAAGGYADFSVIAVTTLAGLLADTGDLRGDPVEAAEHVVSGMRSRTERARARRRPPVGHRRRAAGRPTHWMARSHGDRLSPVLPDPRRDGSHTSRTGQLTGRGRRLRRHPSTLSATTATAEMTNAGELGSVIPSPRTTNATVPGTIPTAVPIT